jgi:hypothetical protein
MSFIISSIDPYTMLEALKQQLLAFPALISLQGRITRGEEVNQDPSMAPWCGCYLIGGTFPTRTLGMGNGFRQQREGVAVVIQNMSRTSGEACQSELGKLQKAVVDCILSDTSIGGTMDVIDDFRTIYASAANQAKEISFQSAVIQFTAQKLVGVSGG